MTDKTPETIYAAVAAAIGKVQKLGKDARNKFDGYDFVSIDKFLALVNPICAEHGLFPWIHTEAIEPYTNTNSKGASSTWARFTFHISMMHTSGQQIGPATYVVSVPLNGAQASGSAQSYALKQFFRGVFMIPTGDKDDADLSGTEQHGQVSNMRNNRPPPEQGRDLPSAETVAAAIDMLSMAESLDDLKAKWGMLPKPVQTAPGVANAKDMRKTQLASAPAHNEPPLVDDEIPY